MNDLESVISDKNANPSQTCHEKDGILSNCFLSVILSSIFDLKNLEIFHRKKRVIFKIPSPTRNKLFAQI